MPAVARNKRGMCDTYSLGDTRIPLRETLPLVGLPKCGQVGRKLTNPAYQQMGVPVLGKVLPTRLLKGLKAGTPWIGKTSLPPID